MKDRDLHRQYHNIKFVDTYLQGVLSTPSKPQEEWKNTTVILVPYGLNPRFGPHQIYLRIERELIRNGITVFRFDSFGCGDSGGDFTDLAGLHRDDVFWRLIFNGKFIEDVSAVVDYVKHEVNPERIILGGICGGAVRALLVASQSKIVQGVIPIAFPSTIDDTTLDNVDKMNLKTAEFFFLLYIKKLLKPSSWLRFFSCKSDYRRIFKSTKMMLQKFKNERADNNSPGAGIKVGIDETRKINNQLIKSIQSCLDDNKKLLVIYGQNDRYMGDFEELIESRYLKESIGKSNSNFKKHIVENSNHEFSFSEWQEDLVDCIRNWIKTDFDS